MKNSWVVPALFSLLFFVFSIGSIIAEGPLGFWPEHTRNMWGTRHSLRSDGRFHFLAILLHRPPWSGFRQKRRGVRNVNSGTRMQPDC